MRVSAQLKNNLEHVIKQNKINHAWQLNQPINQTIINLMCGAPTKACLFCMNQFHKFHHLELRNLILTYFKNILKIKKMQVACRKENGNQILLKMGCWYLKTLRMENLMTWNHLKTRNWKIISKRGWKLLFWNQRESVWGGWHMAQKVAMLEVAMHMDLRCKWYSTLKLVIAAAIFSFLKFWWSSPQTESSPFSIP